MRLKSLVSVAGLAAATAILPLSAVAGTTKSCTAESVRAMSGSDVASVGAELLKGITADAFEVRNGADDLVRFAKTPQLSWESHSAKLNEIRDKVDDMGAKLCRLEAIRDSLPGWQQEAFARTQPAVIEMANYTTEAIKFANDRRNELYSPDYARYSEALYMKAGELAKALDEFQAYAKAGRTEAHMKEALGLKKSS